MTDYSKPGIGDNFDIEAEKIEDKDTEQSTEVDIFLNGYTQKEEYIYPEIESRFQIWPEAEYEYEDFIGQNYEINITAHPMLHLDYTIEKRPIDTQYREDFLIDTYTNEDKINSIDAQKILENPLDWSNEMITIGEGSVMLADYTSHFESSSSSLWRGYVFKLSEDAYLGDIFGGMSGSQAEWGLFEVESGFSESDSWDTLTIGSIVKNIDGEDMVGDAIGSRRHSFRNSNNKNMQTFLEGGKYYFVGQGSISSSSHHAIKETAFLDMTLDPAFEAEEIENTQPLINYWGPKAYDHGSSWFGVTTPWLSFAFTSGHGASGLIGKTPSIRTFHDVGNNEGPDMGLSFETEEEVETCLTVIDESGFRNYLGQVGNTKLEWSNYHENPEPHIFVAHNPTDLIAQTDLDYDRYDFNYVDSNYFEGEVVKNVPVKITLPEISDIEGLTDTMFHDMTIESDDDNNYDNKSILFEAELISGNNISNTEFYYSNEVLKTYMHKANEITIEVEEDIDHITGVPGDTEIVEEQIDYNDELILETDYSETKSAHYEGDKYIYSTNMFYPKLNGFGYLNKQDPFIIDFMPQDIQDLDNTTGNESKSQVVKMGFCNPFQYPVFELPDGIKENTLEYHIKLISSQTVETEIDTFDSTYIGFNDINTKSTPGTIDSTVVIESDYKEMRSYKDIWQSDPYTVDINNLSNKETWQSEFFSNKNINDLWTIPEDVYGPYTISYNSDNSLIKIDSHYITD